MDTQVGISSVAMSAPPRNTDVDGLLAPGRDTLRFSSFIALGLLALSAGSGELYGWPRLASIEGTRVLWLLLPAALLQIPVLVECQRTALLGGRSFFAVASSFSRPVGVISLVCMLLSFAWLGGWLTASSAMIAILFGVPESSLPLATNMGAVLLALVLGWPLMTKKLVARYVSAILKIFAVATFATALLALLLLPNSATTLLEYIGASFRPHLSVFSGLSSAGQVDVLLAITFLGLGSWASTLYTGYASFEGYGRVKTGTLWREASGPKLSLVANWRDELSPWYSHIYKDVSIGVLLNLVSTALMTFLAVRILFGTGREIGRNYDLLSQQAQFFEPVLGALATPIFILLASAFLLDTWVGFVPLMAKGTQEGLQIAFPKLSKWGEERFYRGVLIVLGIQSVVTAMLAAPGKMIRLTAIALNVTHPIVIVILLYANYSYFPRMYGTEIRPSRWSLAGLLVSLVAYSFAAAWYLII